MLPALALALAALAGPALLAWRRPLLRRLAWRDLRRRRTEAVLVIGGCLVGTAVVTASLAVGDTLATSLRARADERLGPVDVIVRSFAPVIADAVSSELEFDPPPSVAGSVEALEADGTLASATTGSIEVAPGVRLLEIDFTAAAARLGDPARTGLVGATPAAGEVALSAALADELDVAVGDSVALHAYGQQRPLTVSAVLEPVGFAGYALPFEAAGRNAFLAPGTLVEVSTVVPLGPDARAPTALSLVAARGGAEATDAVVAQLEERFASFPGYAIETVKADLLEAAADEGADLAELFGSLSSFAVLAGIALLANTLVLLAEERRRDLGVLRALGLRRTGLAGVLLLQGAALAVVAAILGVGAGIALARVVVLLAEGVLGTAQPGGGAVRFGVAATTPLLGFSIGLLASLVVVGVASAALARRPAVALVSDRPDGEGRRAGLAGLVLAVAVAGLAIIGSAAAVVTGSDLAALSLPCVAAASLAAVVARTSRSARAAAAAADAAAVAVLIWAVAAFGLLDLDVDDVTTFVVQGLALTLAALTLLVRHQVAVAAAVQAAAGRAGLVVRLGLAYASQRRVRTATTLLTYSLVMFTLTFSSVLSSFFSAQVDGAIRDEAGGYDVLVTSTTASPVATGDLEAVDGVAAVAPLQWEVVEARVTGRPEDFATWAASGVDDRFVAGGPPPLDAFDTERFASEAEVWEAVLADPRLAIADVTFLQQGSGPPEDNVAVGETVQLRAPGDPVVVEREVVGIAATGAAFSGLFVHRATIAELRGAVPDADGGIFELTGPAGVENRHYVALEPGADAAAVTQAIETSFLANGTEARTFEAVVQDALASQADFFDLIEGYLALGLFVGVAGLGVAAVRAVRRRRGEVAVLRALGLPSASVRRTFVLESGLLAVEGLVVGAALALVAGYQLVANAEVFGDADVAFAVPWLELGVLIAGAALASVACALPPASRAARTPPAEVLRGVR